MWSELQLEADTESRCLHLALQAASFAPTASLQLEANTCSGRQTDSPRCVCEGVVVSFRVSACMHVCLSWVSDLGSGPGTWPRCAPVSDRTPPSPDRGCHRSDRLRRTPGWSWCGSSRCCTHTYKRRRNHNRVVNFLIFYSLLMSRSKINQIWNINENQSIFIPERRVCVCVCVCEFDCERHTTEFIQGLKMRQKKNNKQHTSNLTFTQSFRKALPTCT